MLVKGTILNILVKPVNVPSHMFDDGTQTCIDLNFTNKPYAFTKVEITGCPGAVNQKNRQKTDSISSKTRKNRMF